MLAPVIRDPVTESKTTITGVFEEAWAIQVAASLAPHQGSPAGSAGKGEEAPAGSHLLWEVIGTPGSPIAFDGKLSEFSLLVPTADGPGGKHLPPTAYPMRFDPFSGEPLGSGRASSFVPPDEGDVRRLKELTQGLETIGDVERVLGAPDQRWPAFADVKAQLDYWRLSDTVKVTVLLRDDGRLMISFTGKPKDMVGRRAPRG